MSNERPGTHVKILFEVNRADGSTDIESVWAIPVNDGYRLDNIPFYARGFACGDVVSASPDADGLLRCSGLVSSSAHSTIRLWFADKDEVQSVRDELRNMNCDSELDIPQLVAVDVPADVPYDKVRDYLDAGERAGRFEYEEACLGQSPTEGVVAESN